MNACQKKTWDREKAEIPRFSSFGKCFVPPPSQKIRNFVTFRTRPESVPDVQKGCPSDTWDCPRTISRNPRKLYWDQPVRASGPVRGVADTSDRTGRTGRTFQLHSNRIVLCVCCFVLFYQYWGIVMVPLSFLLRGPGGAGCWPSTLSTSLATPVPSSSSSNGPSTYYVDNQGLVPWQLRRLGKSKVRSASSARVLSDSIDPFKSIFSFGGKSQSI